MTPEQEANFKKWMTALRSGKFNQGFGEYSAGGCVCAAAVGAISLGLPASSSGHHQLNDAVGMTYEASAKVMELNDRYRLPFPAIADEIEKHKAEWFA